MSQGQIQLDTPLGQTLYNLCVKNQSIKTVVEIGTWYGGGSTKCLISGLIDSKREGVSFISLETNKKMYNIAKDLWSNKLPEWANLINGRIVDLEEMDSNNLGEQHQDESQWFEEDKSALLSCPNVISELPQKIDLLFLDGGEFTTSAEFWKLKDRSNIIIVDDTTTRKCKSIREYILNNRGEYKILFDETSLRNGIMGFKKI